MKIELTVAMSPESAKFLATECTNFVRTEHIDLDRTFFSLYFMNVSWNTMWRVKLKVALTELRTFLLDNPSGRELEAYVHQNAIFRDSESKVSKQYFDKALVFAGILASDICKRIQDLDPSVLLEHIEAVLNSSDEWQASVADRLQAFVVQDGLAANATGGSSGAEATHKKQLRSGSGTKAAPPVEAPVLQEGHSFEIYDSSKVMQMLERQASTSSLMDQEANKQKKILMELVNATGIRPLAQCTIDNVKKLYARFPHFKPVLDFVVTSLAMAGCGEAGSPSVIPPILLRGIPGTGKSYFAEELAQALNTSFMRKDLSVTSEAFVISGLDSSWRGAKPGVVFETLTMGKYANPVICLDEVDKARASGMHSSPIAALYALLEPATSSAFKDEFISIELNASKVNWILTANDGDIPEPVLSRLEVFEIPVPTAEECKIIAQSVWESVCREVLPKGHGFSEKLPDDVRDFMGLLSPRVMRKALAYAVGCAEMDNKRKVLSVADLNLSASRYAAKQKTPVGFVN